MYPDLAVFSNAFAGKLTLPVVRLLGEGPQGLTTIKEQRHMARRRIEVWQSKALAQALFEGWQVGNGYQLEQKLMALQPRATFSEDRPRLFHRMALRGEPAIVRELAKTNSDTALWVRMALAPMPEKAEVLDETTWRLLDPSPMGHVEWNQVAETFMRRNLASGRVVEKETVKVIRVPIDGDGGELVDYFVPCSHRTARWGLTLTLLQLRRWEASGLLLPYYLQLLELRDRCTIPDPEPDLELLLPELERHLIACFGQVHVGPTYQVNVEHQLRRLSAARQAFALLAGRVGSPDAVAVMMP